MYNVLLIEPPTTYAASTTAFLLDLLRRNPREQADFTAFGIVTSWHRYKRHKTELIGTELNGITFVPV